MSEMKNICGKIPIELHEKVRAEIELNESSTQLFIQQVIEEHFNRLEGKGELSMEKRTLAVQVSEELFQKVKWAVAKEGMKQKDFIIRIIEKAIEEIEAKWQEIENPNDPGLLETPELPGEVSPTEDSTPGFRFSWAFLLIPLAVVAVGGGGLGIALFLRRRSESREETH